MNYIPDYLAGHFLSNKALLILFSVVDFFCRLLIMENEKLLENYKINEEEMEEELDDEFYETVKFLLMITSE